MRSLLKSVDNLTVLIDTKDHIIIKDTLSHFGFSNVKPTLPYSVFKVKLCTFLSLRVFRP